MIPQQSLPAVSLHESLCSLTLAINLCRQVRSFGHVFAMGLTKSCIERCRRAVCSWRRLFVASLQESLLYLSLFLISHADDGDGLHLRSSRPTFLAKGPT